MKKTSKEKTPVETKEETPQVSTFKEDYKKDLQEIKELLNVIAERLLELKITGGF